MKKMFIILFLLITGCTANDFNKMCTQSIDTKDFINKETKKINYDNQNQLQKVIVTREYKAKTEEGKIVVQNIIKSAKSYNNNLAKKDYIKIKEETQEKDKYVVKYYLDVPKLTSKELDDFDLRKDSIKYFNHMKKEKITCQ